jgi:hypothetical protein
VLLVAHPPGPADKKILAQQVKKQATGKSHQEEKNQARGGPGART